MKIPADYPVNFTEEVGKASLSDLPAMLDNASYKELTETHKGDTTFHLLARRGQLSLLPADRLNPDTIKLQNTVGATVLWLAAYYAPDTDAKDFQAIPKSLLTKENILVGAPRYSTIGEICEKNLLAYLPEGVLDEELLCVMDRDLQPAVRALAKNGTLNSLPRELFTDRVVACMIHEAAAYNHLKQIPEGIITQKHMELQNGSDDTVLHVAVRHASASDSNLSSIPKEFFNLKNLTAISRKRTPLDLIINSQLLDQVPCLNISGIIQMSKEEKEAWLVALNGRAPVVESNLRADVSSLEKQDAWLSL